MIHRALAQCESLLVSHRPTILKKVLLGPGEVPVLTNFSQAVFQPGDVAPGHRHDDMWEVFFVRSGRGTILVDGIESALEEDECWVIEPGEVHEIRNESEADLVLLYFGLNPSNGQKRGRAAALDELGGEPHEPR